MQLPQLHATAKARTESPSAVTAQTKSQHSKGNKRLQRKQKKQKKAKEKENIRGECTTVQILLSYHPQFQFQFLVTPTNRSTNHPLLCQISGFPTDSPSSFLQAHPPHWTAQPQLQNQVRPTEQLYNNKHSTTIV